MKSQLLSIASIVILAAASNSAFAQSKGKWTAPASANASVNPVATSAPALKDGKRIYSTTCAPCHGVKGRGDGAASAALNPKPADHSSAKIQAQSDGSMYWKLTEGRNPMPSYKTLLTDRERWSLVSYIRTLKKN